jgi:hypothetical protein
LLSVPKQSHFWPGTIAQHFDYCEARSVSNHKRRRDSIYTIPFKTDLEFSRAEIRVALMIAERRIVNPSLNR